MPPSSTPSFSAMRLREVGVRAAGEDHQPLLRAALDVVARLGRACSRHGLEPRQPGELSRRHVLSAFHARSTHPSFVSCRGGNPASDPGGTSSVTTVPAETQASSPTVTGATNVLSTPVLTFLPIVVLAFGRSGVVREVRGHVRRGDVRVLADVGVTDVGQMRHLRPRADPRLLDLHERARLRPRLENGAGAKVTERPDDRTRADRRVDGDHVGADLGPGGDRSSRRAGR